MPALKLYTEIFIILKTLLDKQFIVVPLQAWVYKTVNNSDLRESDKTFHTVLNTYLHLVMFC